MARRKRERQKVIRGRVPSDARSAKSQSILSTKLSERSFAARDRALHALADMRHGATPSEAAHNNGVTLRTIKKYVGSALVQDRPGGRLRAMRADLFVRYVQIPGPSGPVEIKLRGSRLATEAAKYDAAVSRFLRGDLKALAPWHGKKIGGVELITSVPVLKGLAQREFLPHSLYRVLSVGAA